MRPGALFVGALVIFALLGLLAGRPPTRPERHQPAQPAPLESREPRDEPEALARRWAHAFAVWTDDTLATQLGALAGTAAPALRAELQRGAQAIQRDRALTRDGAGSRGSVRVVHVRGSGGRRAVLVVTRETPYLGASTDLQGAGYRVYTGEVVLDASGRWLMRSWERQP